MWLKIAAAVFLLPWYVDHLTFLPSLCAHNFLEANGNCCFKKTRLAHGKEDTIDGQSADTDYAMVVIPSVVIPVVVLIEFLGHSRGVLL